MVAWSRDFALTLAGMEGEADRRVRFGYALQRALAARDMSERQLAARLGIDPRRVAAWRKGKRLPDYYEGLALIEILRLKEELLRDPPPIPPEPHYPIDRYLREAVDSGFQEGLRRSREPKAPGGRGRPPRSPGQRVRAK